MQNAKWKEGGGWAVGAVCQPGGTGASVEGAIMGNPFNDNDFELTTDCADCTDNYAEPIVVESGEWGMAILPGK